MLSAVTNTRQSSGYAIVVKPKVALARYTAQPDVEQNADLYAALRAATSFLDPGAYRGIGREALEPHPSFDEHVIESFANAGVDVRSNAVARRRFLEIAGEDTSNEHDYDLRLLADLQDTLVVSSLLDRPEEYEIIRVFRDSQSRTDATLGFDVGWWAGYSIICDCVVMPVWHGPDPEDFDEVAAQVRTLNQHVLFDSPSDAEAFRRYYESKNWAETNGFCVIRVDQVRM